MTRLPPRERERERDTEKVRERERERKRDPFGKLGMVSEEEAKMHVRSPGPEGPCSSSSTSLAEMAGNWQGCLLRIEQSGPTRFEE